jgi:hypothetical protein
MKERKIFGWGMMLAALWLGACNGKYNRLPQASERELQTLTERYRALVAEAKNLGEGQYFQLLHHFSSAALTLVPPDDFQKRAQAFVEKARSGALDKLDVKGARDPGKVRLLLLKLGKEDLAVPFVQEADGWKIDDIAVGLGDATLEVNLKGNTPASPPSLLAAVAVLSDKEAADVDLVHAGLLLAEAKKGEMARSALAQVSSPWGRTALQYALWQSGGKCEAFADAFPIDTEQQSKLYNSDTDSFRQLLKGLAKCAAASDYKVALKFYRGCHLAEAQPRSEYVMPVQELANANPAAVLQAAVAAKINYDEDPAANILVGAFHGERQTEFFKYLTQASAKGGKLGKLAKDWLERMAKRDQEEPPEAVKEQEGAR